MFVFRRSINNIDICFMKFFAKVTIGLFGIILLLNSSSVVLAQGNEKQINFYLQKDDEREKIESYLVDIEINNDASVDIEETIYYDFGNKRRHGIYKTIPVKYKDAGGNKRSIRIKNIEVWRDNQEEQLKTTMEGKELKIRIGKPEQIITGKHTFVIKYTVKRAINYFDDHAEFYWNVIGDKWTVPIYNVSALVKAPKILQVDCFSGEYGKRKKCVVDRSNNDQTKVFRFGNLNWGEFATVVVGVDKGVLYKPSLFVRWQWFLFDNWILFVPLIVFLWAFRRWWKWGRDPKGRGTIIPYYDVPDNLSVAEASAVVHNSLRTKDVSAMIIQLAVKGYIKIEKKRVGKVLKHTNYIFHKVDSETTNRQRLSPEEEYLFKSLFQFGSKGVVSTEDLEDSFYKKINTLKNKAKSQIKNKKYIPDGSEFRGVVNVIGAVVQMMVFVFLSFSFGSVSIWVGVINIFILVGFAIFMGHRTKKGVEMKEKLLGLKLYLKTAEKDRLKFHNAPEKNPKRFEKLLPYAMVFGVEKEWAEQFKDIYRQPPDWYQGVDSQGFDSLVLANSLHSFAKTANSTAFSSPSSASAGGSGFSGGGAGGGFGGGGGGSW